MERGVAVLAPGEGHHGAEVHPATDETIKLLLTVQEGLEGSTRMGYGIAAPFRISPLLN